MEISMEIMKYRDSDFKQMMSLHRENVYSAET